MLLQKHERFQNDVKRYSESIEKLSDGGRKTESKKLLNDLIFEVKNLDNMHVDMVYGKQISTTGAEMKDRIATIRKRLNDLLG